MPLVAVRINAISGNPFDENGDEKDDGWEILDGEEALVFVDTSDVWDILNGVADIRDELDNWTSHHEVTDVQEPAATEAE